MTGTTLMTEGSYRRKIIGFAIPVFFGHLCQQMYNVIDSLIVGNFVGSSALAAVSSSGNMIFLVIGFFEGLSIGASVVIAQYIGARDKKRIEQAVHSTVALGIAASILLSLFGVLMAPVILKWINTPADVMPESLSYFSIYFGGVTGIVMYNTFASIIRASGDSRHPLYYLIISSVVNVVLDLIFIRQFHWGVSGAAAATVISQVLSAIMACIHLIRAKDDCRLIPKKIGFTKDILLRIIRYGLPSGLQFSMISLSNVVIQSFINFYGKMAMAGIGAYTKIEGFVFIPTSCFSMALTTFIGQNIGAGLKERTKKGIGFGVMCTVITSETVGLLLFVFAPQLVALFDSTPEVVAYGVARARVVTLFFCFVSYSHVMAAVLRGLGRAVVPMLVMMICWCGVRVAVLFITGLFFHSIELTYWIYPITWTLSTIVFFLTYRKIDMDNLQL